MAKAPDLANLPLDEFYKVLGERLDSSSALISAALELINTVTRRLDQLETRLSALERLDPT